MARWYCQQVLEGKVPACNWEVKACQRFLHMLVEANKPHSEYVFRIEPVLDACSFIEALPHVKGFEGTIKLEPVQCWWLAGIFGFRERETGLRYVRDARLYIPRKNAKSTLSSGIALFCANCEGEPGAEVVISAGSADQANKVYDPIRKMLDIEPDLRIQFRAKDSRDRIAFDATGGYIQPVASVAKNIDGFNPHLVVAEELHAQKQEVVSVLSTAQGARRMPLFLSISTAGRRADGPAWDDWKQCQAVLLGRMRAPRFFVAMYAPDKDDDGLHFNERVIEKLNPLYGVSLNATSLEKEQREARKSEADLNEYKRTRLNIWSRAAGNLISAEAWDACADRKLNLDLLKGFPMYVGLDLAARSDLNAAAFLVQQGDTLYTTGKYWLPRNVERMKDDRFADAFLGWHKEGWLELTDAHGGTFIDGRMVLRDVLAMLEGHNVVGVALDDHQANLMSAEIEAAGYEVYIVRKNAKSLTPATDDLISRVNNPDLFQHDGNPITAWCAGNVVGHWDQNSNVLPKKESPNSKANIDGIDALILANAIRIDNEAGLLGVAEKSRAKPNPYLNRGLAGSAA